MEKIEEKEKVENMENDPSDIFDDKNNERISEDIESFFSQYSDQGATAHFRRITPLYATGYVGDIPLDGSVGLAEIKDSWGGQKYRVRINDSHGRYLARRTIEIADVPRRNGIPWAQSDMYDIDRNPAEKQKPQNETSNQFLDAIEATLERQQEMIERLLLANMQSKGAGASALHTIKDIATAIEALRGISDQINPPAIGNNPEADMMSLVKTYLETTKNNEPPIPRQRQPRFRPIAFPGGSPRIVAAQPAAAAAVAAQPAAVAAQPAAAAAQPAAVAAQPEAAAAVEAQPAQLITNEIDELMIDAADIDAGELADRLFAFFKRLPLEKQIEIADRLSKMEG